MKLDKDAVGLEGVLYGMVTFQDITTEDAKAIADYIEALESDRERCATMRLGLRNVRAFAKRLRRTDPENAAHLLRFCDDAGVGDSVLRGGAL